MKHTVFTGSGVALITPMHPDLSVNFEKLKELIEFHIENETDAIVITGTTGEASTLTDEEHLRVISYTVECVAGRIQMCIRDSHYAAACTDDYHLFDYRRSGGYLCLPHCSRKTYICRSCI